MRLRNLFPVLVAAFLGNTQAAEYMGNDVDGQAYSCTAYSYSTGNYYYLTCEFSGDEVILNFPNGGYLTVSMDSEEIEDPSSISAYDYARSTYWDLDVDM